jgi:hypothetical protein
MTWPQYYVLDAERRVVCATLKTWGEAFEDYGSRTVARQSFGHQGIGTIEVSTVFIGVNHRFIGEGPPLVFETMIFGGGEGLDGYTDRCATWDEAEAMHRRAVEHVKNAFSELAKASGA